MELKERIENLGTYFSSMNVASENGIIYVQVKFPQTWGCSELTEYNFNVKAVRDEIPGYFYFFADLSVGFDKIFDAIDFNIQFNKEAQAKVALLREKVEELKKIFEEEDIAALQTLEFKYKKKKPKTNKIVKNDETKDAAENEMNITHDNSNIDNDE